MILIDETYELYEYHPDDLPPCSKKLVVVQCENAECGKIRSMPRDAAGSVYCKNCAIKLTGSKRAHKASGKNLNLDLLKQDRDLYRPAEHPCKLCGVLTTRNKYCFSCEDKVFQKMHEINIRNGSRKLILELSGKEG